MEGPPAALARGAMTAARLPPALSPATISGDGPPARAARGRPPRPSSPGRRAGSSRAWAGPRPPPAAPAASLSPRRVSPVILRSARDHGVAGQLETVVAVGGHLVALAPVVADAADVRQEQPRLAGDVG